MSAPIDNERFVAAVEAIYDAAPDPSQWPRALAAVANIFGGVGGVLIWQKEDGAFGTVASASLKEANEAYQAGEWWTRDTAAQQGLKLGYFFNGEPCTNRHFSPDDEMRADPYLNEFLIPHGLGWIATIAVSPDPRVAVAISVHRKFSDVPFSDSELGVLARIARHVEKSLRLSIRLLDAELLNVGLGEALTRVGIGVFGLDSLGRVVFSNPAGKQLLGENLQISQGRLQIGSSSQRSAIDVLIAGALRGGPTDVTAEPRPILVQRASSDRPLVVYLLPITTPINPSEHFLTHVRAIVLVIEPTSGEPADPAVVRDILGLTLGEARVAALVGFGLPPREAAERLGIAEETARNVLKRVFSKVGVSRQSELVGLLTKLVLR